VKQHEGVATESSPVEVQAIECDTEVSDQHAVDSSVSEVDENTSQDAAAISSTVAASSGPDCQSSDTVAKSSTVTVIGHVIPRVSQAAQLSESEQQDVVCVDSDVCTSPTGTAAGTDETVPGNLTPSSPVIDIIDDDDAGGDVADEAKSSDSKRMKETVVNAWQGRNGSAMKSLVKKALALVSTSTLQGTNSPLSANSNLSPTVTAPSSTSHAAVISAKHSAAPPTTCIATSTVTSCRGTVRGTNTTASQSAVPTARVIGHIVTMRQSSPQVTSAPHRAVTTVTQSTAASVSPQVTVTPAVHPVPPQVTVIAAAHPVNPPVTVTRTVHPTLISTTAARASSSNESLVAKNHSSTPSRSASSGRSRPAARRGPRSRRVAVLRPEDLYEISSQIVAQVLQHNKQTDIITCDDDDDQDDDGAVAESYSSNEVVVIDEPASSSRQVTSARHPRPPQKSSSATAAGSGARTPSGKRLLIPPSFRSSSSKPSRRGHGPSKASDDVTVIDDECRVPEDNDDVVCCDEDDTLERTSANPVPTRIPTTAAAAVAVDDDSDDAVCYDEDVPNVATNGRLERTPANPFPTNRASASASAAVDDDDVLICDTPAPNETRPNPSSMRLCVGQSDSVTDTSIANVTASHTRAHRRDRPTTSTTIAASHMSCSDTSVFAALVCPEDLAADELILVEPDSPTALSVTASHNGTRVRDGPVTSSTVTANRPPYTSTSTSAAVPHQEVPGADEVVLVEPDNSTSSSDTATINARRDSSSPLIILD